MTTPFQIRAVCDCDLELILTLWLGRNEEKPWQESTPAHSTIELPSRGSRIDDSDTCILVLQVTRLLHWQSILCTSKLILSKILSSLWSSSMIDMLRSIVKVYQPLTHNSLAQALLRYFSQSLSRAPSQDTPLS